MVNAGQTASSVPARGGASSLHVDSIVLTTVGGGKVKGRAQVTIVDDLGAPVSGVVVTGTFRGDYKVPATRPARRLRPAC